MDVFYGKLILHVKYVLCETFSADLKNKHDVRDTRIKPQKSKNFVHPVT